MYDSLQSTEQCTSELQKCLKCFYVLQVKSVAHLKSLAVILQTVGTKTVQPLKLREISPHNEIQICLHIYKSIYICKYQSRLVGFFLCLFVFTFCKTDNTYGFWIYIYKYLLATISDICGELCYNNGPMLAETLERYTFEGTFKFCLYFTDYVI